MIVFKIEPFFEGDIHAAEFACLTSEINWDGNGIHQLSHKGQLVLEFTLNRPAFGNIENQNNHGYGDKHETANQNPEQLPVDFKKIGRSVDQCTARGKSARIDTELVQHIVIEDQRLVIGFDDGHIGDMFTLQNTHHHFGRRFAMGVSVDDLAANGARAQHEFPVGVNGGRLLTATTPVPIHWRCADPWHDPYKRE